MGCGGSKDEASQPQQQAPQQQNQGAAPPQMGSGATRGPVIGAPSAQDPPFMRTAAPCGMSWGQYCKGAKSFIDPTTGLLGGSWAECIAWGVVFEHANDWDQMPEYQEGPVGGILEALGRACGGRQEIMDAADRLEAACHQLAESGQPMPAIQQAVKLPANAVPGQQVTVGHPQMPGAYQKITVPQGGQPGQTIMTPAPVQPTQTGKTGMSTGSKVAFAAGGVVAVGGAAGVAYYATQGGGFDGFTGDVGAAGDWAGGAAGDAGDFVTGDAADWAGGAAGDAGDWTTGAAGDVGGWAEGTAAPWAEGAAGDVGEWTTGAADDVGGFLSDLF